jgi:hypothetical protein
LGIGINLRQSKSYIIEDQEVKFPLLEKEGWTGKLISGDFETLIARTGWLIVAMGENSDDKMVLVITL